MKQRTLAGTLALAVCLAAAGCARTTSDTSERAETNADLVILGGTYVTMDAARTVIENGGLAVVDGAIAALGPRDEIEAAWTAAETIQANPADIVIPGLVNGHGHALRMAMGSVDHD